MTKQLSKIVAYPFLGKGRGNRLLTLFLIGLVPLFGQIVLIGYFLRVAKIWFTGDEVRHPDFSAFGQLVADGFVLLIAAVVYLVPAAALFFIPKVGGILSVFWVLFVAFIFPVPLASYAVSRDIVSFFAVRRIFTTVRDRILPLAQILLLLAVLVVLLLLPPVAFTLAGNSLYNSGAGALWQVLGVISVFAGILIEAFALVLFGHIYFAAAGVAVRSSED